MYFLVIFFAIYNITNFRKIKIWLFNYKISELKSSNKSIYIAPLTFWNIISLEDYLSF